MSKNVTFFPMGATFEQECPLNFLTLRIKVLFMENTNPTGGWLRSLTAKFIIIALLILVLLIPRFMVLDLIRERQNLNNAANEQVAGTWGLQQKVTGPYLAVPYSSVSAEDKNKTDYGIASFLPEELNIDGNSKDQLKKRGIYKAILYEAQLRLSGSITPELTPDMADGKRTYYWDRARVIIGLSDLTGVAETPVMTWNEGKIQFSSGVNVLQGQSGALVSNGISAVATGAQPGKKFTFDMNLRLKGSAYLGFEPVGKSTHIQLRSTWPSPSFTGRFATDSNQVSKNGFVASWKILDLNRSYPQQWLDNQYAFSNSYNYRTKQATDYVQPAYEAQPENEVGVEFMQTVSDYSRNTRTAKYAILVIGLTFLIYFFSEMLRRMSIHPLHYILVGVALMLFYVLVLSISEHLGFSTAYVISAVATIALIAFYSAGITDSRNFGLQVGGLLAIIYTFIYTILQLEDYALLAGTLGLFITLAIVMYYTRRVRWDNVR